MRFKAFDWGLTVGCAALLGYFAWHANEGPRGYKFRDKLLADAARLESELVTLEKERSSFEDHVALLRPNSVDPDLLDQLARERLEMAKPDELIVRTPAQ
jgi:cell division protein FtsB